MSRRVNLHLPEDFVEYIEAQKPRSLALSAFCALLIEQALTGEAKLPAYCVGAGSTTPGSLSTQGSDLPTQQALADPQPQAAVQVSLKETSSPKVSFGEGVGKGGSQGGDTPREGHNWKRTIPDHLADVTDLIEGFWRVKKGSKGSIAWSRLMGQLNTLRQRYGTPVLRDQLELAINGKWNGVEVSRYEQFKPAPGKPGAPEPKHPASRVFKDGRFVDEPVTNPILKDLF